MKTHLLVALLATASLAACGGEEPSSGTGANGGGKSTDPKQAMLDYAKCMRDNGVDMPDPEFDGNHVKQMGPKNVDKTKMRAAEKACASIREAVKPPELSDEKKAEFKKAALANAKCMREQGINFPDPVFDESGGARINIKPGTNGFDPDSPKFKAAAKVCDKLLPDAGQTDQDG